MTDTSMLRRLWPYLRPDSWAFALALVLTPATAGLSLVQPWILKNVIDEHMVPGVAEGLMALALLYLGAVVAGYLLEGGYVMSLAWGGQRSIVRLRSGIYRKLLGLAPELPRPSAGRSPDDPRHLGCRCAWRGIFIRTHQHHPRPPDDRRHPDRDVPARREPDAGALAAGAADPGRARDHQAPTAGPVPRGARGAGGGQRLSSPSGSTVSRSSSSSATKRTLKTSFDARNDRFRRATTRSNVYDSFMYALVDGTASICVAVMFWYGSGLASRMGLPVPLSEPLSAGLLVAFIEYLDRLFRPLRELSSRVAILQRGAAALEKILALLDVDRRFPPRAKPSRRWMARSSCVTSASATGPMPRMSCAGSISR